MISCLSLGYSGPVIINYHKAQKILGRPCAFSLMAATPLDLIPASGRCPHGEEPKGGDQKDRKGTKREDAGIGSNKSAKKGRVAQGIKQLV